MMSTLLSLLFVIIIWCCKSQETESLNDEENDYKLVSAETRNIMFVGRSRAGKSTLIDVLKDKNYNPPLFSILRGNIDVSVESFTMKSPKQTDLNLQFNIMDTPGLFERTLNIEDKRTNEIILDVIKKCIDMEITKINHVYFVMSIQQGLNDEDLESFRLFTELFLGMENKISIIISFAQHLATKKEYDHYRDQFKKTPELNVLYKKINGRIFFLGAIQKGALYDTEILTKNVYSQRRKLFQHIIQQNKSYNVKQLQVYKQYISLIGVARETLANCCKDTETCIDIARFDNFIKHYTFKEAADATTDDIEQEKEEKEEEE